MKATCRPFGYASEDDPSQINIYPLTSSKRLRSSNVLDSYNAAIA